MPNTVARETYQFMGYDKTPGYASHVKENVKAETSLPGVYNWGGTEYKVTQVTHTNKAFLAKSEEKSYIFSRITVTDKTKTMSPDDIEHKITECGTKNMYGVDTGVSYDESMIYHKDRKENDRTRHDGSQHSAFKVTHTKTGEALQSRTELYDTARAVAILRPHLMKSRYKAVHARIRKAAYERLSQGHLSEQEGRELEAKIAQTRTTIGRDFTKEEKLALMEEFYKETAEAQAVKLTENTMHDYKFHIDFKNKLCYIQLEDPAGEEAYLSAGYSPADAKKKASQWILLRGIPDEAWKAIEKDVFKASGEGMNSDGSKKKGKKDEGDDDDMPDLPPRPNQAPPTGTHPSFGSGDGGWGDARAHRRGHMEPGGPVQMSTPQEAEDREFRDRMLSQLHGVIFDIARQDEFDPSAAKRIADAVQRHCVDRVWDFAAVRRQDHLDARGYVDPTFVQRQEQSITDMALERYFELTGIRHSTDQGDSTDREGGGGAPAPRDFDPRDKRPAEAPAAAAAPAPAAAPVAPPPAAAAAAAGAAAAAAAAPVAATRAAPEDDELHYTRRVNGASRTRQ